MSVEITYFTPLGAYPIAPGVAEICGIIDITSYVVAAAGPPVTGEQLVDLTSKFRNNLYTLLCCGDTQYDYQYDFDLERLVVIDRTTGAQVTAGGNYEVRFVAKGEG